MGPNLDDPDFGAEYFRRESPKLRVKRQRRERIGGLIILVASVGLVIDAGLAFHTGGWSATVRMGPRSNHEQLPWWWAMGIGLIGLLILAIAAIRRDPPPSA